MRNHHGGLRRAIAAMILVILSAHGAAAQHPFVRFGAAGHGFGDTLFWYAGTPVELAVFAGPEGAEISTSEEAKLSPVDRNASEYSLLSSALQPGLTPFCVSAMVGADTASECLMVVAEQPELRGGMARWRGMRATVGRRYDPSSEWTSMSIPASHYQTIVTFNGSEVFDRPGTQFRQQELSHELMVGDDNPAIVTTVYWKPAGTADRTRWVAILSSRSGTGAAIEPEGNRELVIAYPAPEHLEGFEFDWTISGSSMRAEFGPVVLRQRIGENRMEAAAEAGIECTECSEHGIAARLVREGDDFLLRAGIADISKLDKGLDGRRLEIPVSMLGRGHAAGSSMIVLTIHVHHIDTVASRRRPARGSKSSPIFGGRAVDPDREISRAIRLLGTFRGRGVNIYAIEPELRGGIVARIQVTDAPIIDSIEAIGRIIHQEPLPDFAPTVLQIAASHGGARYQQFRSILAQRFGMNEEDLDDLLLQSVYSDARRLLEIRKARPDSYYLVTTSKRTAEPLALVGTGYDESATVRIISTTGGASMKALFDAVEENGYRNLIDDLAVSYGPEDSNRSTFLRKIWPEGKRR